MSGQHHLSLLLDSRALKAIADKIWTARNRLQLHTEGRMPNPLELYAALKLHRDSSDTNRLQAASSTTHPLPSHPSPPSLRLLYRLVAVCLATYSLSEQFVLESLLAAQALPPPIHCRAQAEKFSPGYAVVRDDPHGALLLCIRGSREAGDLLTNLSSDAEPFLAGFAHQGIVKSARKLHSILRPLLSLHLSEHIFNKNGLLIFGHSLGGAVASALTLLLRYKKPPKHEPPHVTNLLTNARCYAFSPPPFLDNTLMNIVRKKRLPITTIVYGLDVVPRLSTAHLDRLLQTLAAYDFSPHVTGAVSRLVRSVTQPVIGSGGADRLAKRAADVKVNAKTLANVSGVLASAAGSVLRERSLSSSISHEDSMSLSRNGKLHRTDSRRSGNKENGQDRDRLRDRNRSFHRERSRESDRSRDRSRGRENGRNIGNRGRGSDTENVKRRERRRDSERSRDSGREHRQRIPDRRRYNDVNRDSRMGNARPKNGEFDRHRDRSLSRESDRSNRLSRDTYTYRGRPQQRSRGRFRSQGMERKINQSRDSHRSKDLDRHVEEHKDSGGERPKGKEKLKGTDGDKDENRKKKETENGKKHSREGRGDQTDDKDITGNEVSHASGPSRKPRDKQLDEDDDGLEAMLSRRASETEIDRRKRKNREGGKSQQKGKSSKMRRSSTAISVSSEDSNGSRRRGKKNRNRDEDTSGNSSPNGRNILGGTIVNAMLLATKTLGSEVQSNASRYARRKSAYNSSTSSNRNVGMLKTSASAHSLPTRSRVHSEGYNSNSNSNADERTTDLPEMYLAGEVWHMDRVFVAPTPDVQQNSWPIPRLVKRKAEYFDKIEVSAWMLFDHDTTVMFRDLERML